MPLPVVVKAAIAAGTQTPGRGSDRISGRYEFRVNVPPARAVVVPADQSTVVEFLLGDVVSLRRAHPCGGREWLVDRLGADLGLRCRNCNRHVLLDRRTVERRMTGFVERGDVAMSLAVAPTPRDAGNPAAGGSR